MKNIRLIPSTYSQQAYVTCCVYRKIKAAYVGVYVEHALMVNKLDLKVQSLQVCIYSRHAHAGLCVKHALMINKLNQKVKSPQVCIY